MSGASSATDGHDQLGDELRQHASQAGNKAKQKLDETAERISEQARSFSDQQRSIGAEQIVGIADAVHIAAQELEARMPKTAQMVHSTADQLTSAAAALRQRSVNQLLSDIGDFARREPAIFFGGAVLAGFTISRFLRASATTPVKTNQGDAAEPRNMNTPPSGMGSTSNQRVEASDGI
jgi:hypothetical protein